MIKKDRIIKQLKDNKLLICACNSLDHQIILQKDEDANCIYATIHLRPCGLWQRICHAIKYIFGFRSVYGDFDEFIFDERHIDSLKTMVYFLEKHKSKINNIQRKKIKNNG